MQISYKSKANLRHISDIYEVYLISKAYLPHISGIPQGYIRRISHITQVNHMGDFTQPQQKYAGTGENCIIAIAVIFYPGIKLYENFLQIC